MIDWDYERRRCAFGDLPGQYPGQRSLQTMPKDSMPTVHSFRGQGTLCKGRLTITLTGPQGCGKSLAVKILKSVLPFTPICQVDIIEQPNG